MTPSYTGINSIFTFICFVMHVSLKFKQKKPFWLTAGGWSQKVQTGKITAPVQPLFLAFIHCVLAATHHRINGGHGGVWGHGRKTVSDPWTVCKDTEEAPLGVVGVVVGQEGEEREREDQSQPRPGVQRLEETAGQEWLQNWRRHGFLSH